MTFPQWQTKGQDKNSLIADPHFNNVAKFDFTLTKNSPALKLGFKPIDLSTVGSSKKFKKSSMPRAFPEYEPAPK